MDRKIGDSFSWEDKLPKSWEAILDKDNGDKQNGVGDSKAFCDPEELYRTNIHRNLLKNQFKRAMIRHVCLVLDLSNHSSEYTMNLSKLCITLSSAKEFVVEYFDNNPIGQMGIVVTRNGLASIVSEMNSNPQYHLDRLEHLNLEPSGEPSLQNSLLLSMALLKSSSSKVSKEVLVVYSSISTCDSGNIFNTIKLLKDNLVKVSIISLSCEFNICEIICNETLGILSVALSHKHFISILLSFVMPLPLNPSKSSWKLIKVGFPETIREDIPVLCSCHQELITKCYLCPLCKSYLCKIPCDCVVCGLPMVSLPHLAKSQYYLFPLPPLDRTSKTDVTKCFSCKKNADDINSTTLGMSGVEDRHKCSRCLSVFCTTCSEFIQQHLHSCPGCLYM